MLRLSAGLLFVFSIFPEINFTLIYRLYDLVYLSDFFLYILAFLILLFLLSLVFFFLDYTFCIFLGSIACFSTNLAVILLCIPSNYCTFSLSPSAFSDFLHVLHLCLRYIFNKDSCQRKPFYA